MADVDPAKELADEIRSSRASGALVKTKLETDDRVLARITDGIYRQPASALRELISNAYDADATRVVVQTDVPRFSTIRVSDNGSGMTIEALSNLIKHIGGSAKRTREGASIGVVNPNDPTKSPGGRPLIGKIGIGLFSVSQLTKHFRIITKRRSDDFRLVADVMLRTYSEEGELIETEGTARFETGNVEIWTEPASDIDVSGTDIILLHITGQARDILQSRDLWVRREQDEHPTTLLKPPAYHVGSAEMDARGEDIIQDPAVLPWNDDDPPEARFRKLIDGVFQQVGQTAWNPTLSNSLDRYLNMLWTLASSIPAPYETKHPFDLGDSDNVEAFFLSNANKGGVTPLNLKQHHSARKAARAQVGVELHSGELVDRFDVIVDEVLLRRPVRLVPPPKSAHALQEPLLFLGSFRPNMSQVREDYRGGAFAFEAYLYWTPKVVPKEHIGVLVRVHEATGIPYDETFMKYQVAEQTILGQITGEIFVTEGLDAALNIDRESFNYTHPHYRLLNKWLHRALRQVINQYKKFAADARGTKRREREERATDEIGKIVEEEWTTVRSDGGSNPTPILFATEDEVEETQTDNPGAKVFPKATLATPGKIGGQATERDRRIERQVAAIGQLLEAHGLTASMSPAEEVTLLRAIARVLLIEEKA